MLTFHYAGTVYQRMGNMESALVHYQDALAIQIEAFGGKHEKIARTMDGIGIILKELERYHVSFSFIILLSDISLESC